MIETWHKSEASTKKYLSTKGLNGKNGRIYKNGIVLSAKYLYGQYSKSVWYCHIPDNQRIKENE